jgi:hypothetical protein
MTKSTHTNTKLYCLLSVVILSSSTMLWLFWHYPVSTAIGTLVVLSALGICARLARWIDTEGMPGWNSVTKALDPESRRQPYP